jgi:hypothetical protein
MAKYEIDKTKKRGVEEFTVQHKRGISTSGWPRFNWVPSTANYAASARTSTSDLFTVQFFSSGSVRSYSISKWL